MRKKGKNDPKRDLKGMKYFMRSSSAHRIDVAAIIADLYPAGSRAYDILRRHGDLVAAKALSIADGLLQLKPNHEFIQAAACLHDIGICLTDTPALGCFGRHPYICHGYLGRQILEDRGLPDLALVCERHVGVGISAADVRYGRLPLPERNMLPVSIEEQIICYADKFFSKNGRGDSREKTPAEIIAGIGHFGPDKVAQFLTWARLFEGNE